MVLDTPLTPSCAPRATPASSRGRSRTCGEDAEPGARRPDRAVGRGLPEPWPRYLPRVAADMLAETCARADPPADAAHGDRRLDGGTVTIALRRLDRALTARAARATGRRRARWPLFLGLAATVFVVDQLTKAWLVSFLAPGERLQVVGDYIRLVHSQNSGALFGLVPRPGAVSSALVSIGVIGADRLVPPRLGTEHAPVGRARAAARRRARQHGRPVPPRLRRRLRGHRHRRPALLHVQRRRRGDQPAPILLAARAQRRPASMPRPDRPMERDVLGEPTSRADA